MINLADVLFNGVNIKKENNLFLGKTEKFIKTFYDNTFNFKELNKNIINLKKENFGKIFLVGHDRIILKEKIKNLQRTFPFSKNPASNEEKIRKIKAQFFQIKKFIYKVYQNKESIRNGINALTRKESFDLSIKNDLQILKNIVFENLFICFKNFKNKALMYFKTIEEQKQFLQEKSINYPEEIINEHKEFLDLIENQYQEVKDIFSEFEKNYLEECNLLEDLFSLLREFTEQSLEADKKIKIFCDQLGDNIDFFTDLGQNHHRKFSIDEAFFLNLQELIDAEKVMDDYLTKILQQLSNYKIMVNGYSLKPIENRLRFIEECLIVINDKVREMQNIVN